MASKEPETWWSAAKVIIPICVAIIGVCATIGGVAINAMNLRHRRNRDISEDKKQLDARLHRLKDLLGEVKINRDNSGSQLVIKDSLKEIASICAWVRVEDADLVAHVQSFLEVRHVDEARMILREERYKQAVKLIDDLLNKSARDLAAQKWRGKKQ